MCLNICMSTQKIPPEFCFMRSGKTESRKQGICEAELRWGGVRLHLVKLAEVSAELVTAAVARIRNGPREVSGTVLKGGVLPPEDVTMISLIWESCLPPGHFAVLMWTKRQRIGLLFCLGWWYWLLRENWVVPHSWIREDHVWNSEKFFSYI